MEVKYAKKGINQSEITVYINDLPWRVVKSTYFERKLPYLIKKKDFKKEFTLFEKKKILSISIILLSKRSYLKKEWISKMEKKLFDKALIEEVYTEILHPYFNEEEEVERRVESYALAGKGKKWIVQKMSKDLSCSTLDFELLLQKHCSPAKATETIRQIAERRNLLESKGREKTIAFFLRRGYNYSDVQKALF